MTKRAHPAIVPGPYRLLHGGDYNPEQWLHRPDILAEDAVLMRKAGVNQASVAIFAWAAIEPERDRFEFAWLDGVMDRLHAQGVGVLLATPTAARPRWLAEAHPEVMQTRADGTRAAPGDGRHNMCWSSSVLRERAAVVIERMAQRYSGHPALLGWHINNEYGGSRDYAHCHCDTCVAGFRQWLKHRYDGDLERLNRAWWTGFWSHQYQSWEQIRPGDGSIEALPLNWKRFSGAQIVDFCAHEIAAVRRHSAAPVTVNMHGNLEQYDHGVMARQIAFTSYDSYPGMTGTPTDRAQVHFHAWLAAATRGFGRGKPWLLMESCPSLPQYHGLQRLKRPGVHRLLSLSMVAEGSDGVCYFQWRAGRGGHEKLHGAVLMQEAPHDSRVFREVAALGGELAQLSALAGAATPAAAAVVWDVESEWARGHNSGLGTIPRPRDLAVAWHRPLWEAGVGADVVDATGDLTAYRLVVVPGVFLLRPGFAARLEAAARAGAQVVIDSLSAWLDEDMGCVDGGRPGPLRASLGVRSEELDQLREDEQVAIADPAGWFTADAVAVQWTDRTHVADAEVLAHLRGGFHDGWPLLTRRKLGAGAMWYVAGGLRPIDRAHLLARLCTVAAIAPCLPGLPHGVVARERTQPDRRYITLMNPGDAPASLALPAGWTDALSGAPLSRVELAAWDVRIIMS